MTIETLIRRRAQLATLEALAIEHPVLMQSAGCWFGALLGALSVAVAHSLGPVPAWPPAPWGVQ